MDYSSQIARMLHDEHMTEIARFERLESLLLQLGPGGPPADQEGSVTALLIRLAADGAPSEHHFAFEEKQLFPRLAALGEVAIGDLLTDEHKTIRDVGAAVTDLVKAAQQAGFTHDTWREFHRLGLELTERTISHIQKEEMGLLPMVEQLLEDEEDTQLALDYVATR
ncbi:MAG TPA: hemerythrin domain-containing protein [Kiloniellales bacterium]